MAVAAAVAVALPMRGEVVVEVELKLRPTLPRRLRGVLPVVAHC